MIFCTRALQTALLLGVLWQITCYQTGKYIKIFVLNSFSTKQYFRVSVYPQYLSSTKFTETRLLDLDPLLQHHHSHTHVRPSRHICLFFNLLTTAGLVAAGAAIVGDGLCVLPTCKIGHLPGGSILAGAIQIEPPSLLGVSSHALLPKQGFAVGPWGA